MRLFLTLKSNSKDTLCSLFPVVFRITEHGMILEKDDVIRTNKSRSHRCFIEVRVEFLACGDP